MKVMTRALIGPALNWAVAVAEGHKPPLLRVLRGNVAIPQEDDPMWCDYLEYSTDPALSQPILDRIDGLLMKRWVETRPEMKCQVEIHNYDGDWVAFGPTLLVAGLRCYVLSKLGEEVDVPEELVK